MNWRRIVYVRVGQVDLEISEAVQWGKALHEAMWRCSTAFQMEEKELEGKKEKETELEGEREKGKDGGGGDKTGEQQQHQAQLPTAQSTPTPLDQLRPQPPPTPPLEPPLEVDGAEHDAKQNALTVLLVVIRSMLAHGELVSYEKRDEERTGDGEDRGGG